MKSGLEHRFKVHLRKRAGNRAGDKAAYRVVPSPPRKSSSLTRTAGERTRTTMRVDPGPCRAVLRHGLMVPGCVEMRSWGSRRVGKEPRRG